MLYFKINRIRNSHVNGTVIKGGVACNVRYFKDGYHSFFSYRNARGDSCAFKVDLTPSVRRRRSSTKTTSPDNSLLVNPTSTTLSYCITLSIL